MTRVAVGVSDWPETMGERFDIVEGKENETDAELIARAKSHYYPDLEVVIEQRGYSSVR